MIENCVVVTSIEEGKSYTINSMCRHNIDTESGVCELSGLLYPSGKSVIVIARISRDEADYLLETFAKRITSTYAYEHRMDLDELLDDWHSKFVYAKKEEVSEVLTQSPDMHQMSKPKIQSIFSILLDFMKLKR